jgi:SAM-dependent methyltransferase
MVTNHSQSSRDSLPPAKSTRPLSLRTRRFPAADCDAVISMSPTGLLPILTSTKSIPFAERRILTESFVDPNGRVFEWQGEIYRLLEPAYAARWKEWMNQGVIPGLIRDGLLVESELTHLTTESGKPVLHHRRIPVISYCYEWVPGMLKQAALVTLDLCIRLAERGLTLQDGHPWNILFDGTKPVYIDASSIVPTRDDILWAPYQQFCNFFLFPLYLYAAGCDRPARWLLRDYLAGVTDDDLLSALPVSFKLRHPRRTLSVTIPKLVSKLFERLPDELQQRILAISKFANSGPASIKLKQKFFESLRRDVDGLQLRTGPSHWAKYYDTGDKGYFQTDLSPGDWRQKHEAVRKILTDLRPQSVLDVGSNAGHYAKMAAVNGARVTACETDVSALTQCYDEARKEKSNILSLAVNVFSASPTPGRGGVACPPPTERFRSNFVMGLAVIHHVVAGQRISIAPISEIFAALSSRWLLLEYAPPLKPKIGASAVPYLDDYTVDSVENCLKRHFSTVSRLPSFPDERKLFLCEK